jgi:hypothetical protein
VIELLPLLRLLVVLALVGLKAGDASSQQLACRTEGGGGLNAVARSFRLLVRYYQVMLYSSTHIWSMAQWVLYSPPEHMSRSLSD